MTTHEKMKDALAAARVCISSLRRTVRDHETAKGVLEQIDAALALPARNCDKGSPKKQAERFHSFCERHSSTIGGLCDRGCPCLGSVDLCNCMTCWAQMPYKESEVAK